MVEAVHARLIAEFGDLAGFNDGGLFLGKAGVIAETPRLLGRVRL